MVFESKCGGEDVTESRSGSWSRDESAVEVKVKMKAKITFTVLLSSFIVLHLQSCTFTILEYLYNLAPSQSHPLQSYSL